MRNYDKAPQDGGTEGFSNISSQEQLSAQLQNTQRQSIWIYRALAAVSMT